MNMRNGDLRMRFRVLFGLALLIGVPVGTTALAKTPRRRSEDAVTPTATHPPQETQAEPLKEPPVSVTPVRSQPLRDIWPIPWWATPESDIRANPLGRPDRYQAPGYLDDAIGARPHVVRADADGCQLGRVGVGLAGFFPNSNPPT
jgi:hypothetical protein